MMRAALIVLNQNTELGLYCPDLLKQQSVCTHSDKLGRTQYPDLKTINICLLMCPK